MPKALLAISAAAIRDTPFFVLEGPEGRRLACQWTCWSGGRARGCEFEIVCPETPEAMGSLFGLFEDGEFRMRPAIRTVGRHVVLAPDLDLDQAWRGDLNDVLDCGHDWRMGPDGLLEIDDPEAPAADPEDAAPMRLAA